jgi:hypothetical protein
MNCYFYKVLEDRIMKSKEINMENFHEEADSKAYFNAHTYDIFLHLNLFFKFQMITHLASVKEPAHVVIRSWDTDVLVIALANCHLISDDISI